MAEPDAERECRICRGEDEPNRPLLHPCRCSGSIKFTHEDCLVNWLAQSGSNRCELCNHSFRFEPLYEPDTPSALPTKEFIVGVLALTKKTLKTAARIVLVFTVWLFFLPVGTCWTWYALFINAPSQLPTLIATRGPTGVVTDAFYGFLLSAGIVFIFLGVSSLREYVRHFPQDGVHADDMDFNMFEAEGDMPPDDFDPYDSDDQQPADQQDDGHVQDAQANAPPVLDVNDMRHPRHVQFQPDAPVLYDDPDAPLLPAGELNDEVYHEFDELVRDTFDVIAGEDSENEIGANDGVLDDDDADDLSDQFNRHGVVGNTGPLAPMIDHPEGDSEDEYEATASDILEDEEYDPQLLNAPPQHHQDDPEQEEDDDADDDENDQRGDGGAIFGIFDLDPDEVPLEEVVGLRGRIRNLFDNAGTMLVSNAIFLGVFTLIPLLIGRLTLRLLASRIIPSHLLSYLENPIYIKLKELVDIPDATSTKAAINATIAVSDVSSKLQAATESISPTATQVGDSLSSVRDVLVTSVMSDSDAANIAVAAATTDQPLVSYVDNFLVVLLGYGMIALAAVSYIGIMSMLRQRYPRLNSPITRQIARMLRYVATFVKIVVLILFEFGIFPLGCGWWLDICTLKLFGGTLQSRVSYCQDSPWTCTAGHWVMGIIYMVHISLFISLLREVVRPELLWFLRNPDDPEFHPFRELVEKPLSRHARRICISAIIYIPLIVALVYVPGQLCLKLLPDVFPFRSEDFSHILIDVPFGNLLIGPLIRLVYFGRPEVSLQKLVEFWIRWVSIGLGIEHLVIKSDDGEQGMQGFHVEQPAIPGLPGGEEGPLGHMLAADLAAEHGIDADLHPGVMAQFHSDDMEYDEYEDPVGYVRLRGTVMIVLAWLTLITVESALLAFPTILGRSLMNAVGLPGRHDLHPFLLGLNVLLGSISGISKVVKYVRTVDTLTVLSSGLPYLVLGAKGIIFAAIWLLIIPLAAGLLFELILVPIRVSHNETPYFCLHQDWALGLLLLKVWTCIAVTGGLGAKWREKVLRAREGDFIGLDQNFGRTMREVILPVLVSVLSALSVPYSIARGLLPMLGVAGWISDAIYRNAYLVIACSYCWFELLRYSVCILRDLHDSIRDDKYLKGKRLYNFMESPPTPPEIER